jgi:hypothetical protein
VSITFWVKNTDELELNVSNNNAFGIFADLNIEGDYSGSIDGAVLVDKLDMYGLELEAQSDRGTHYRGRLMSLAALALEKGERVVWA